MTAMDMFFFHGFHHCRNSNVFRIFRFIQVKNEGRALFLNAVCMKCLDGKDADRKLCCRFCATQWDGSSLIMGTMYAYDVFAAMPCCNERLKVCIYTETIYCCQFNRARDLMIEKCV